MRLPAPLKSPGCLRAHFLCSTPPPLTSASRWCGILRPKLWHSPDRSARAGRFLTPRRNGPNRLPRMWRWAAPILYSFCPARCGSATDAIVQGLTNSVNLGVGQFCTCPGLIFGVEDESFKAFRGKLAAAFEQAAPATMLHPGILKGYEQSLERVRSVKGVTEKRSVKDADPVKTEGSPVLFETDAAAWLANEELAQEVFGPSAIVVHGQSEDELLRVAHALSGTLTATIHGTPEDLKAHRKLSLRLKPKPDGCSSMVIPQAWKSVRPCTMADHILRRQTRSLLRWERLQFFASCARSAIRDFPMTRCRWSYKMTIRAAFGALLTASLRVMA